MIVSSAGSGGNRMSPDMKANRSVATNADSAIGVEAAYSKQLLTGSSGSPVKPLGADKGSNWLPAHA